MTSAELRTATVDVLIVNYRTPDLTIQAARSVLAEPELRRVIIVDNASGGEGAEPIRTALAADPVEIIASEQNLGFGGGNNLAARSAKAQYLFLLNSDAYVKPGCLEALQAVLDRDTTVGLAAPSVYLADESTLQEGAYGRFPTPMNLFLGVNKREALALRPDWISGVAFLARRSEYGRLGGFDEGFFMYHEDVDLCRRYRAEGLCVQREPAATVVHLLGRSAGSNASQKRAYDESQDRYLAVAGHSAAGRAAVKLARGIYRRLRP